MADRRRRLAENVEGEFFVDSSCIDCDTCRQLAPATFAEAGDTAYVYAQPVTPEETRQALRSLLACPTGSIGTVRPNHAREVRADFPLRLEAEVYYCGFNSEKSFGGNSYFIRHPEGNWLVDSPRYLPYLARRLEELGGVQHIFLTHRDDVADAEKYARRFGSRRVIHRAELAAQPDAERVLDGQGAVELGPELLAIPTPGHTRGHCVLLYQNRFLFTGDHLSWSRKEKQLHASRRVCWYSWVEQKESLARLQAYRFEWVLPGHGQRVKLAPAEMQQALGALLARL